MAGQEAGGEGEGWDPKRNVSTSEKTVCMLSAGSIVATLFCYS